MKPEPTRHEHLVMDVLGSIRLPFEREKEIRGHPVLPPFYVDFYIPPLKLIIEVDGYSHDTPEYQWYDRLRDRWHRQKGRRVAHIRNEALDAIASPSDLIIDVLMQYGYLKYLIDFQACECEAPEGARLVKSASSLVWHDIGMFGHYCEARYKLRSSRRYDFISDYHIPHGRLCYWCERRRFEVNQYCT